MKEFLGEVLMVVGLVMMFVGLIGVAFFTAVILFLWWTSP